QYQ
ncbi:hypothetical protein VCHENC02_0017B, partial [Vibrio harveyi]